MTVPRIGAFAVTPCTCSVHDTIGQLRERLPGGAWELCCVVSEGGIVLGTLRPPDLDADPARQTVQVMDTAPSTFRPDVPVEELKGWFARHDDLRAAPVTTPEGRLLGTITRTRLDAALEASTATG
jgi:Mg/Co/Ni transporter MgtE